MPVLELLEKGRALAERIPYSVIALASRIAVADIFWRSGRTKVSGFSIREETFYLFREEYKVPLLPPDLAAYLSTIGEHVFPVLLVIGLASRLSALGAVRHDAGDPAVRRAGRLARAHPVVLAARPDHRAGPRRDLARSPDLERARVRCRRWRGKTPAPDTLAERKAAGRNRARRPLSLRAGRCPRAIGSREER